MNGQRYFQFLNEYVEETLENLPHIELSRLSWQQDSSPWHNIRTVRNYLDTHFNKWIGCHGTIRWPTRSPDLTPLDFL